MLCLIFSKLSTVKPKPNSIGLEEDSDSLNTKLFHEALLPIENISKL